MERSSSIENQEQADNRLPILLDTVRETLYGTAVVFVSCQPLLSAIDLTAAASGREFSHSLDLVLAGEESQLELHRANPGWFRSLRDQCLDFDISFFFKQIGRNGKKLEAPYLDGVRWTQLPASSDFPELQRATR